MTGAFALGPGRRKAALLGRDYTAFVLSDGLGARIRDLRLARGITQRELAEPRYSRGFLAAVESGHRVPGDEALAFLAERLGVQAEDLKHGRPAGSAQALKEELEAARRTLSRGDDKAAAKTIRRVLKKAEEYHLPETEAYARLRLGDVIQHRHGPTAAHKVFLEAQRNDPGGTVGAVITSRVAGCLYLTGQASAAIELVEEALHTLRARPPVDPDVETILLGRLVYPYLEVGAVERARRVVEDGIVLLPHVRDPETIADFLTAGIQVWDREGHLSEVDEALSRAREIFAGLGFEREIGACYWTHGYILVRLDRLSEASEELTKAREILARVGARHFHGGATLELAEVRRKQGLLDEAESLCHEAAAYVREAAFDEGIAETDRLLGRIALARGDRREGERLMRLALQRYSDAGLNLEMMRTSQELGEMLLGQERMEEALTILRQGVAAGA